MDLITTHANADFDGLSSLVAARKLYPNARLLLPGSREKAVRRPDSIERVSLMMEIPCVEIDKTALERIKTGYSGATDITQKLVNDETELGMESKN